MPEQAGSRTFVIQPCLHFFGHLAVLIEHMTHGQFHTTAMENNFPGKTTVLIAVDISRHGRDRCDPMQLLDDDGMADIAGVENRLDPGKMFLDGRIKEPVCIRNHAQAYDSCAGHGTGTG